MIKRTIKTSIWIFAIAILSVGCDTTATDENTNEGKVKLQFKKVESQKAAKASSSFSHDSLLIEGSNGTLLIDDIQFIVEEFEMEPSDDEQETEQDSTETEEDDSDHEEFETGPYLVDLPLGNNDSLTIGSSDIPEGLYEELEFEVDNLDLDDMDEDEDEEKNTATQALADSIRTVFPDWPDEGSMIITGVFTDNDGNSTAFKVYAKAEIEVEMEFNPPLEVTENNRTNVLSVQISPADWLLRSDGTVIDLTAYDWDENGTLLEFSAEFENGIKEVEAEEVDFDGEEDEEDDD